MKNHGIFKTLGNFCQQTLSKLLPIDGSNFAPINLPDSSYFYGKNKVRFVP
jgi:hypothetical protein